MYGFFRWLFYSVRKMLFRILYILYLPIYYVLYIPFRILYGPTNFKQVKYYAIGWFALWFLLILSGWAESDTFLGGLTYVITHLDTLNYKGLGIVVLLAVGATLVFMFMFSIPRVKEYLMYPPLDFICGIRGKLYDVMVKGDSAISGAKEQMEKGMTLNHGMDTFVDIQSKKERDAKDDVTEYEKRHETYKSPVQIQREKRMLKEREEAAKQEAINRAKEYTSGTPDFVIPGQNMADEGKKN